MKKLNITKKQFNESKYFQHKYGKLEYVSESGKVYKTSKGKVLKFKESKELVNEDAVDEDLKLLDQYCYGIRGNLIDSTDPDGLSIKNRIANFIGWKDSKSKGKFDKLVKESWNKYDVPYHTYELTLADGSTKIIDVGVEEDWGDVQECTPDDCKDWRTSVGCGNDEDGHVKIVKVEDCKTGETWRGKKVKEWAEKCVWTFVDNYATESSNDIDNDPAYTYPYCGGHNCEFVDTDMDFPDEGYFDGSVIKTIFQCNDCEDEYNVNFKLSVDSVE